MPALQVRDVPEDVREALVARARAQGVSLQGLLLELLTVEARRARNVEILRRSAERATLTMVTGEDVDLALDEARARRDDPQPAP